MRMPAFGTEEYRVRFWKKVDKSAGPRGCWRWLGSLQKDRRFYGNCWRDGRWDKAHRVAWELTKGAIPDGLVVMHLCDNGWCVNPDHLAVGTVHANNFDAKRKGRVGGNKSRVRPAPPAQPSLIASDSVDR